jgi:DNA primase
MQRTGRIGRIEVKISSHQGNSEGEIIIPSSLDSAETALIAATMETIERIGPCTAKIKLVSVEDTRSEKRKYVVEKAKEILKALIDQGVPDSSDISEQIKESVRAGEITNYHGLPCGPNLLDSDDIVIVEGRADVINLLKYGIKNTVAVEGTSIPPAIPELIKQKVVTIFVDGDRGGQLIIKGVMQVGEVDYIAIAPEGKEVEELTKKEVYKALREKIPTDQFKVEGFSGRGRRQAIVPAPEPAAETQKKEVAPASSEELDFDQLEKQVERKEERRFERREGHFDRREGGEGRFERRDGRDRGGRFSRDRRDSREHEPISVRMVLKPQQKEQYRKTLDELVGTRAACLFNEEGELMGKVPVTELENAIRELDNPYAIVFDGKVDYSLGSVARMKGVKILVGMEKDSFVSPVMILCRKDLE